MPSRRGRLKRAEKFVSGGAIEEEGEGYGELVSGFVCIIHREEGKGKGERGN